MNTSRSSSTRGSIIGPWRTAAARGPATSRHVTVAREHTGGYEAGDDHEDSEAHHHGDHHAGDYIELSADEVGPSLRDKVRAARHALREVLEVTAGPGEPTGGEVASLLELLAALDTGHAAAVELTATAQRNGAAERRTGLPLENLLSFQSRAPYGERRALTNVADQLPSMPHLRRAFHAGAVGWAELRSILAEARSLNAEQRARLDEGFADLERLARLEPDALADAVRDAAAKLRPDLEEDRARRVIERRFFSLQPALDGSGTGYFELDPAGFAPVAEAIQAALPGPSAGPRDVSRDAVGEDTEMDAEADEIEQSSPDGDPAFCDPVAFRSRARQRADALVHLAEVFLARPSTTDAGSDAPDAPGTVPPGSPTRARPSIQVICEVGHLTGDDAAASAARALVAAIGGPVRLTAETVRRLSCDTHLQLIFTEAGEVLGTTDPTDVIPRAVRRAVKARDQGCRFPGCSAPHHWTDLHHVQFRRHDGPTTVANLVALCRRHHTAVHEGGWKLDLDRNGTLTVARGRRRHTSDPPLRRTLLPD